MPHSIERTQCYTWLKSWRLDLCCGDDDDDDDDDDDVSAIYYSDGGGEKWRGHRLRVPGPEPPPGPVG